MLSYEACTQARKRHININFLVRLLLGHPGNVPGTNRVCPRDKVGLFQGQTQVFFLFYTAEAQFVPGTNPVCPWDIPGTKGGRQSSCVKSLCAFFVPYAQCAMQILENSPSKFECKSGKSSESQVPSRPKSLQNNSLQKSFLEAMNFVIITKTLCIQLKQTRERPQKHYKKNCFRVLFCNNFAQDGKVQGAKVPFGKVPFGTPQTLESERFTARWCGFHVALD